MDIRSDTPYECHVFVCTNDRLGKRKSCADGDNVTLREALKGRIAEMGWKGKVRISKCGCLGLCQSGPNVIIYPQEIWFSDVSIDEIDSILNVIGENVTQS